VPRLCEVYPGICLTTEEKARKNVSQGSRRLQIGTMKTECTEQSTQTIRIHKNNNIGCALTVSESGTVMEALKCLNMATVSTKSIATLHPQSTIFTGSLTILTVPLPQSHDSSFYVSRRILAHPPM
jgi:hypothetical protein